jgi:hypothetical protein
VDIDGPTTLREQLEQARELENERRELMEGGADYAGTEAWRDMMRRVGRLRDPELDLFMLDLMTGD